MDNSGGYGPPKARMGSRFHSSQLMAALAKATGCWTPWARPGSGLRAPLQPALRFDRYVEGAAVIGLLTGKVVVGVGIPAVVEHIAYLAGWTTGWRSVLRSSSRLRRTSAFCWETVRAAWEIVRAGAVVRPRLARISERAWAASCQVFEARVSSALSWSSFSGEPLRTAEVGGRLGVRSGCRDRGPGGAGGRVPDGVERGVEGRADVIVLVCEGLLEAAGGGPTRAPSTSSARARLRAGPCSSANHLTRGNREAACSARSIAPPVRRIVRLEVGDRSG